jgi:hypothetical protein
VILWSEEDKSAIKAWMVCEFVSERTHQLSEDHKGNAAQQSVVVAVTNKNDTKLA